MKTLNYTILLKPEKGGGYTVVVPSLPGCVTFGKNLEDARFMAKDAIEGYVASLVKHKESVPSDDSVFFSSVNIVNHDKYTYA